MYLKQIELENFKSFGGKLSIPLLEGYMAITGPNGSGKSNISDAILFVLGPKSSKAIRAGKLSDLIFDGGKSRKASDFTKVSLVFDNSDRVIPWDADTVRLTRLVKMSSSGEGYNSYFYVNDHRSSLSEFDELLSSARISAEGYNLVQQGDVTRIVEMGNLERRRVLDGISGISRFDADIIKAEEERRQTDDNLERISIIKKELETQLLQLDEERKAARRYLDAKDGLDTAKAELVYKNLELAQAEADSTRSQIDAYDQEIAAIAAERRGVLEDARMFEAEKQRWEREIEDRGGDEYRQLKERRDELMVEAARRKDRAERADSDIMAEEGELETCREEAVRLTGERVDADAALTVVRGERDAAAQERDSVQANLGELREEIESRGGELSRLQDEIAVAEEGVETLRDKEHRLSIEKGALVNEGDALEREMSRLEEDLETAKFETQDAEWQMRELKKNEGEAAEKLKDVSQRLRTLKTEESRLSEEERDLRQALHRLERDYISLKAEKEAAENLQKGYNRAVVSVLEARDRGTIKGIHGTIAELAEVDAEYETALSVAAGGRMQAIIVDDDSVASQAIDMLKRTKAGRATFLPLSKMQEGRPRAKAIMASERSLGYAIDLVRFDPVYRPAFWHVLSDTVVTEDLASARQLMGGVRLVTLDGEVIEAAGAMVGGSLSKQGMKFGSAAAGRLEAVAEELRIATGAMDRLVEDIAQVRGAMRSAEEELRVASSSDREFSDSMARLQRKRDEARERRDSLKGELDSNKAASVAKDAELKAKDAELAACSAELDVTRESLRTMKAKLLELAPEDVQRRLSELQDALLTADRNLSAVEGRLMAAKTNLKSLDSSISKNDEEVMSFESSLKELVSVRDSARAEEKGIRTEMAAVKSMMQNMEDEVKELRDKRDDAYRKMVARNSEAESLKDKITTKEDFQNGLRVRLAQADQRLEQLRAEAEEIKMTVPQPLPSLDNIRSRIRKAEAELEAMGNVNLRAIEDYEEKKDRHDRMMEEVQRLESQREELLALMDGLNKEKKTVFDIVYKAVDENFRSIYADLSGGGEAYLSLEHPEDPFLGGLLINAKPKNGKLLRLEALSGGEKSLTALAFIFALQEHQPSPFYLLDEVDMFLDSVNAEMVARRVKQSCAKAQFVQISLRKVTLGKADHLMGVTRQPNGISKVIMQPNLGDISSTLKEAEGST